MGIKHAFVSPKSDGADTDVVRPSDWNADHVGIVRKRKTGSSSSTSTSLADVPELIFDVEANTAYHYKFIVFFFTSATTVGLRLSVNGPSGTIGIRFGGIWSTGAQSNAVGMANAQTFTFDTSLFATTTGPGVSGVMGIVEGTCYVQGTPGQLALRFASETGASVTIEDGSYGELSVID